MLYHVQFPFHSPLVQSLFHSGSGTCTQDNRLEKL